MSVLLPLDLMCNMLLGDILKYRQPKRTEFFGCDCAAVMYFLINVERKQSYVTFTVAISCFHAILGRN